MTQPRSASARTTSSRDHTLRRLRLTSSPMSRSPHARRSELPAALRLRTTTRVVVGSAATRLAKGRGADRCAENTGATSSSGTPMRPAAISTCCWRSSLRSKAAAAASSSVGGSHRMRIGGRGPRLLFGRILFLQKRVAPVCLPSQILRLLPDLARDADDGEKPQHDHKSRLSKRSGASGRKPN